MFCVICRFFGNANGSQTTFKRPGENRTYPRKKQKHEFCCCPCSFPLEFVNLNCPLKRETFLYLPFFFDLFRFFCTKKVHVIILKYTAADEITVHMHALKTHRYLDMYDKISGSFQWNPPAGFWNRTARLEFAKTTDSIDIDGPPSSTFAAAQRQKSTPNTPMHREKIRAVYGYSFFDGIREIFS